MPISKAESRIYNWQVQRSMQTQSLGEKYHDNILPKIDQRRSQNTSKDRNKRYITTDME